MITWRDQLYQLLPAVHQIRDGAQGEVLRAWLHVIGEQAQDIQDGIEQLYDNWFIETCDDWVVPYIGDLVGFRTVGDVSQSGDPSSTGGQGLNRFLFPRREIASLVRRRRRKGTLSVLEDIAKDATGWPARAVEFSRLVNFFQNVRHPMPAMGGTLKVRDRGVTSRIQTPFDRAAHTVDVRQVQSLPGVGWYHPKKVGLFVWRRKVYSATKVCPCRVCENVDKQEVRYYTFSRLGRSMPLFVHLVSETDDLSIAEEHNLPVALTRDLLRKSDDSNRSGQDQAECQGATAAPPGKAPSGASSDFYGLPADVAKSLAIYVQWPGSKQLVLVPAEDIVVCCLAECSSRKERFNDLGPRQVAVDPESGRFVFGCKNPPQDVRVSYHYSMAGDVGGGEYERRGDIDVDVTTVRLRADRCCEGTSPPNLLEAAWTKLNGNGGGGSGRCGISAIQGTLTRTPADKNAPPCTDPNVAKWTVRGKLCIEIIGSDTFQVLTSDRIHITSGSSLEIRAARGTCPFLHVHSEGPNRCGRTWQVLLEGTGHFALDGLLVDGAPLELGDWNGKSTSPTVRNQAGCVPCDSSEQLSSRSTTDCADHIPPSPTARIDIRHTTFVPGGRADHSICADVPHHPSLVTRLSAARIRIRHSIVGTINVEHHQCHGSCAGDAKASTCPLDPIDIDIADSVIDAAYGLPAIYANCCNPAHADVTVARSTILGDICVQQISRAEDSLFGGLVHVQRRSVGYMRFCFVPTNRTEALFLDEPVSLCFRTGLSASQLALLRKLDPEHAPPDLCFELRTPARFKCLPERPGIAPGSSCAKGCGDLSPSNSPSASGIIQPRLVSTDYGTPGYCQLAADGPEQIFRGAEDESELGVFHDLYHPQRQAALKARLQEYTPADMQAEVIYADDLIPFVTHHKH